MGHDDVNNTCAVGVLDGFSEALCGGTDHHTGDEGGEVPMALVVLTAMAAARAARDPKQVDIIKTSIMKVCLHH